MARRRSSRSVRREDGNYVWQAFQNYQQKTNLGTGWQVRRLFDFYPGRQKSSDAAVQPFDDVVILSRFRGNIVHLMQGGSGAFKEKLVPIYVGAQVLPSGLAEKTQADADQANPFFNGDGEDYFWYEANLCDAGSSDLSPTLHAIDNKAKRKVNVGDLIRFNIGMYIDTTFGTGVDLDIAVAGRILWKLKL